MRTTTLTAAGLLGLALLSPLGAASAAGETCRGEAATIVGTGPTITGTEERDVVVTRTAAKVTTLGGDDLVCVGPWADHSLTIDIDAGTGSDVVDTSGASSDHHVTTVLGAGADSYVGGAAADSVVTGDAESQVDDDTDNVITGAGEDDVVTGSTKGASHDRVDTGAGADGITLASTGFAPDAALVGGDDSDTLRLDIASDDVKIDMEQETVVGASGAGAFSSLEETTVTVSGNGKVGYRGSMSRDVVRVHPRGGVPTVDLRMRAGDDEVVVEPATVTAQSYIYGAKGTDRLVMASKTDRLAWNIRRHRVEVGDVTFRASTMDDAFFMAPEVKLVGDNTSNELSYVGCRGNLHGKGGSDSLVSARNSYFDSYTFDCRGRASMSGGRGADELRGSDGPDRLAGNRGRDTIKGRDGRDILPGGKGRDTIKAGKGRDVVWGGRGRDTIKGQAGQDTLRGGRGRDKANGGKGGRDLCRAEHERRCER